MKLLERFKAIRRGFPQEIKDLWLPYYAMKFSEDGLLYENGEPLGKVVMPMFKDSEYIYYDVGETVPVLERDGWTGYYKITRITKKSWVSDLASYDDGKGYYLKFSSLKPTKPLENK